MKVEWNAQKAAIKLKKHGIDFADAAVALEDQTARRRVNTMRVSEMSEDFSKGKRGPVVSADPNKVRITIRLDADILQHFKRKVLDAGGGNYQTLINDALRRHIEEEARPLEDTLRRVIREELSQAG